MWRTAFLAALLSLAVPVGTAGASERVWSAEDDARNAKGKALYRRAIRLDRDGDYRGALDTLLAYREYAHADQLTALERWEADLRRSLGISSARRAERGREPESEREEPRPAPPAAEDAGGSVLFAVPAAIDISFGPAEGEDESDPYEDEYPYEDELDPYEDEFVDSATEREGEEEPLDLSLPETTRRPLRPSVTTSLAPNPAGPVLIVSGSSLAAGFGVVSAVTWTQGREARGAGDQSGYEDLRPANNAAFALTAVGGALVMGGITAAIVDRLTKKRRSNRTLAEVRR